MISAPPAGADITWDFSKLVFQDDAHTMASVAPASTAALLHCGIAGADTATIYLVSRSSTTNWNDDYHDYIIKGEKTTETGSNGVPAHHSSNNKKDSFISA